MNKVKVGVIGVGYLGSLHAEKYSLLEEAELAGVVDVDAARAKEVAEKTGTRAYTNYKELFDIVQAVSIATPTESHFKIALEFLKRGKDVLVEKPMTMTVEEADVLVKESAKRSTVLQVGHLERFNPAVLALAGRVKEPLFIESRRLSPFPGRSTDIDVILDLMIHDIDIILNLVGSEVESIDAVGVPVVTEFVDIANARIKFRNGCVASATASRVSKEREREIRVFQHDSFINIDYMNQKISITNVIPDEKAAFKKMTEEELPIEKRDILLEELKAFTRCSLTRTPPLVSGKEGKLALSVALKVREAAKRGVVAR